MVKKTKIEKTGGLVVTRRKGKSIQIGKDIFITFLSHDEERGARLRVQAPNDVLIRRVNQIS